MVYGKGYLVEFECLYFGYGFFFKFNYNWIVVVIVLVVVVVNFSRSGYSFVRILGV